MILPSGAELKVSVSPFSIGRELQRVIAEEALGLKITANGQVEDMIKNMFFAGIASRKIEAAIWECMKRATYNGLHITMETFEPVGARGDYYSVCAEVARENLAPFTKDLFALFSQLVGGMNIVMQSLK